MLHKAVGRSRNSTAATALRSTLAHFVESLAEKLLIDLSKRKSHRPCRQLQRNFAMDVSAMTLSDVVIRLAANADALLSGVCRQITKNESTLDEYYFLDRRGETLDGSALHRLVASKLCTTEALLAFLDNRMAHLESLKMTIICKDEVLHTPTCKFDELPPPPSIRKQYSYGATSLHLAVHRNSIHVDKIIQLLLGCDCTNFSDDTIVPCVSSSLVSIPMNCGSYPLHVLTGQNATINEKALKILVDADPTVIWKEDKNGDNPVSLLWKNTLRFRWAISIMEGAPFIDYIDKENASSWMTITTPWKYIRCTLLMLRAALRKHDNEIFTVHELCAFPRCPPILLMLAMLPEYNADLCVQGSVYSLDENGRLPLHHAVKNAPAHYRYVPDYLKQKCQRSLVSLLLDKFPDAVQIKDSAGRLPLHYALENGCMQETDLMRLVELYPAGLKMEDPVSGLYPFMLVSHTARASTFHLEASHFFLSNKFPSTPESSSEDFGSEGGDLADLKHCMEWKKDHVRVSFLLLSLCPEAMQYHQRFGESATIGT